jgi:hypothetical protein
MPENVAELSSIVQVPDDGKPTLALTIGDECPKLHETATSLSRQFVILRRP